MAKLNRKPASLEERLARHQAAGLAAVNAFELAASKLEQEADDLRILAAEAAAESNRLAELAGRGTKTAQGNLIAASKIRALVDGLEA